VLHGQPSHFGGSAKTRVGFLHAPKAPSFLSPGFPKDSDRTSDTSVASPVSPRPIVRDPSFLGAFAFAMMLKRQEPPSLRVLCFREETQLVHKPRCLPSLRTLRAIRPFTGTVAPIKLAPNRPRRSTVSQHRVELREASADLVAPESAAIRPATFLHRGCHQAIWPDGASSTRPPFTLASHLFRGAGRGLMWSRTLLNDFCNETQLRARPGRFILTDEGRNLLLFPRDERHLAMPVFRGVSRAPLRTRPRRRVTPGVARGCDADISCAFHEVDVERTGRETE
jgi:hypothetical protein